MSGFVDRFNSIRSNFTDKVKNLSNLGMQYQDMVLKNTTAVGVTEAMFSQRNIWDQNLLHVLSYNDIGKKNYISYFDKEYLPKRDYLRKISGNSEIELILETLADETIVYNDTNFFAEATLTGNWDSRILDAVSSNFKRIYVNYNFNNTTSAWEFFKQLLVDGGLSFENIWNTEGTKIIGFKELEWTSLRPSIEMQSDGTYKQVWYQYEHIPSLARKLYEPHITYISFSKSNLYGKVSYVERLIRSFNLLRTMENSRVLWNLMNSTFRMKMVVPIGAKSPQRAKESLGQLMSIYKEDITLDETSGELFVSGTPGIQFFKNYIIPSKNGEQVEIDTLEPGGHDLSNTDALKYFSSKLIRDSRIPFSRFDTESGGGAFTLNAEGVQREEIRFNNFIIRLRSIYQEILLSPLYWQMLADFPSLRGDHNFKSQLGLKFFKNNTFDDMRDQEILTKQAEFIGKITELKGSDEKQIIPTQWAVKKWLKQMTHDDWVSLRDFKASMVNGENADDLNTGASSDSSSSDSSSSSDDSSSASSEPAATEPASTEEAAAPEDNSTDEAPEETPAE